MPTSVTYPPEVQADIKKHLEAKIAMRNKDAERIMGMGVDSAPIDDAPDPVRPSGPLSINDDHVDMAIAKVDFHVFPGTTTTVCCLTLRNGWNVTGESACVSPAQFDKDLGERIAYNNARQKIFGLEGYLLKEKLVNGGFHSSKHGL
jgi:hypothetical protein